MKKEAVLLFILLFSINFALAVAPASIYEYSCKAGHLMKDVLPCPEGSECLDGACRENKECIDTDISEEYPDGKNYFTKGWTKGEYRGEKRNAFSDYCRDSDVPTTTSCEGDNCNVKEYYCTNSEDASGYNYKNEIYSCPKGCKDGACIPAS